MATAGEVTSAGDASHMAVRPRVQRRLTALVIVFADQAVTSGGNSVTMLLLARWLSPAAFGGFGLVYAGLLLLKNMHLALVTTPLMTIGGALTGTRFARYRSALTRVHVVCSLLAVAMIGVGGVVLERFDPGEAWHALLPSAAIAIAGLLGHEFVRRALLAEQARGAALVNDLVRHGLQVGGLVGLHAAGLLTAPRAFLLVAASGVAATLLALPWMLPWHEAGRRQRRSWYRESFDYGKWLAGHYAGVWVIERWYLVGIAALVSTVEAGAFVACVTVVGVLNLFYLSFENYAVPVFARHYATEGASGVRAGFATLLGLGGLAMAVGCGLLAGFGEPLLRLLFDQRYTGYGWFLGLVALQTFVGFFARSTAIGLKILRRTREVFWAYTGAAVITIVVSGPLIAHFGLAGAGVGMVLTQVALAVPLLLFLFVRPSTSQLGLGTCAARAQEVSR